MAQSICAFPCCTYIHIRCVNFGAFLSVDHRIPELFEFLSQRLLIVIIQLLIPILAYPYFALIFIFIFGKNSDLPRAENGTMLSRKLRKFGCYCFLNMNDTYHNINGSVKYEVAHLNNR